MLGRRISLGFAAAALRRAHGHLEAGNLWLAVRAYAHSRESIGYALGLGGNVEATAGLRAAGERFEDRIANALELGAAHELATSAASTHLQHGNT